MTPLIPLEAADSDQPLMLAAAMADGPRITGEHHHGRGQLIGLTEGVLVIDTDAGRWVVPAAHAVWVPPGHRHGLTSPGPVTGWSLYLAAAGCAELSPQPQVMAQTALLRAVVARRLVRSAEPPTLADHHLALVVIDEIAAAADDRWTLALPRDRRLRRIALALLDQPADPRPLTAWAAWAAIAPRSLSRHFTAETGLSFSAWRRRARLLKAVEQLALGAPVTTIAFDLGYDTVSGFIAAFARHFGTTPARYRQAGG